MICFIDILNDYTLRAVVLGALLLGSVCGAFGTFAVLKKQSLIGDMISHSALAGIALSFLISGKSTIFIFISGALISALLASLMFSSILKNRIIKSDSAIGVVLTFFFGLGILLLTFAQTKENYSKSGIEKFLFGQASAITLTEVFYLGIFALFSFIILILFWKEFKIYTFDSEYASVIGFNTNIIGIILIIFFAVTIVIGLQMVGVILMSSMLVAPATTARQWTESLSIMTIISALTGALAGVTGVIISSKVSNLPTGPVIVVVLSIITCFSILFSPKRGIIFLYIKRIINGQKIIKNKVLLNLYELSLHHNKDYRHGHNAETLCAMGSKNFSITKTLNSLQNEGMTQKTENNEWSLTEKGFTKAQFLINNSNKKD